MQHQSWPNPGSRWLRSCALVDTRACPVFRTTSWSKRARRKRGCSPAHLTAPPAYSPTDAEVTPYAEQGVPEKPAGEPQIGYRAPVVDSYAQA
jgi:hypothetical protein